MLAHVGVLGLLILGEALVIYAEMIGARLYGVHGATFGSAFSATLIPLIVGATFLIFAYMLGVKYLGNVWIVTVVSMGAVLLVEPLFNLLYMGQTPTTGALIGFVLGALGILATFLL